MNTKQTNTGFNVYSSSAKTHSLQTGREYPLKPDCISAGTLLHRRSFPVFGGKEYISLCFWSCSTQNAELIHSSICTFSLSLKQSDLYEDLMVKR